MSRYRKIDVRIWVDSKVKTLSSSRPSAQFLFFYLLSCPETTNIPGLFRAGEAQLAEALGWSLRAFRRCFAEISGQDMVRADWQNRVVFIPNAITYNFPESPNVIRAWRTSWGELPDCPLMDKATDRFRETLKLKSEAFTKAFNEILEKPLQKPTRKGASKPLPNQEQEQEQEQDKDMGTVVPISETGVPPCPHNEIVSLYHEILPELSQVREWTADRQKLLRSRWKEKTERQSLDWWRGYFEYVRGCPLLMGQADGGRQWEATLEWLVRPKNFIKVIEGNYQSKAKTL